MIVDGLTRLSTAADIASSLGVHPETVLQWARQGRIPRLRVSGKVVRFDPVAVLAALEAGDDDDSGA